DLPNERQSGLSMAIKVLRQVDGIAFSELTKADVVRHPLVQRIVAAYEKYEM
ncbi:MAG: PhoH family protein, partial [Cyanobacteria bacterium P01_D01_bin.2]